VGSFRLPNKRDAERPGIFVNFTLRSLGRSAVCSDRVPCQSPEEGPIGRQLERCRGYLLATQVFPLEGRSRSSVGWVPAIVKFYAQSVEGLAPHSVLSAVLAHSGDPSAPRNRPHERRVLHLRPARPQGLQGFRSIAAREPTNCPRSASEMLDRQRELIWWSSRVTTGSTSSLIVTCRLLHAENPKREQWKFLLRPQRDRSVYLNSYSPFSGDHLVDSRLKSGILLGARSVPSRT